MTSLVLGLTEKELVFRENWLKQTRKSHGKNAGLEKKTIQI